MGFFLEDADVTRITAKAVRAPKAERQTVAPAPGCDGCIMRESWPRLYTPKMPVMLGRDPDIFVVGDAPRRDADQQALPFSEATLRLLRKVVPGREWERLSFQNAVRCSTLSEYHPRPKPAAVASCAQHLDADFFAAPHIAILGIGDTAMRRFVPDCYAKTTATNLSGQWLPVRVGDRWVWYYQLMGLDTLEKYRMNEGPAWPVFAADIKKFFKTVDNRKPPVVHDLASHQVHIVHTLEDARAFRATMVQDLAWDVETTGLRPTARDELLLTAAFSDGERSFAFSVDHPLERNEWSKSFIVETLQKARRWIAHNASMELAWAAYQCGLPIDPAPIEDTMAIARVENDHENLLALAEQSRIHLGVNVKSLSDLDTRNLIAYPLPDVLRYNGLDAFATKLVFDRGEKTTTTEAYRRHIDAIAMTTQMQLYGLPHSLEKSLELQAKWQAKADMAVARAKKIYEVREWERATRKEWSIANDQDTADALIRFGKVNLPRTDATSVMNYKTDEATLLEAAPDNPLVKSVLDYREAAKLVSTYIKPLIDASARHVDGQPHPCYNVLLVSTERLSSEDPNIQNFPRRANGELRQQIVAPPGHLLIAFDYGQLEARLIAMASKDRFLCDAVLHGYDIHADWGPEYCKVYPDFWHMMSEIAGTDDDKKVRKIMRDRIKNKFVFPSFYGANPKSIDGYLELPEGVTAEVHQVFWQRFTGVKQWIRDRRREYDNTGSIRTLTGRVRHSIMTGNEPLNTPIQGTGANVVADAMNECAAIARAENDPYMHPRIQIHDDLTFIWPDDHRLEGYVDRVFRILAKCRYDWQILPFLVEAKGGTNWEQLEEFATFTGDYVK